MLNLCCDRKARVASAQSFTLWQQATIEFTCHDHSIIACSRHLYMGVVLRAHAVRGESHNQRNANGEDATLAGHVHKLDVKRQSLCGSDYSLFVVRILAKPYHFGVN